MSSFREKLISILIGAIGTLMIGGVKAFNDLMSQPSMPSPIAPVVKQTTADWLWYQVAWWILPAIFVVALVLLLLVGLAFAYQVATGKKDKSEKPAKLPREFEQWRLDRMVNGVQAIKPSGMEEKPAIQWLTLADAVQRSTPNAWILGQAIEEQPIAGNRSMAGKLLTVNPQTTQMAILGASGGGKTDSAGHLLLLYARRFGWHPIVLDGKGGLDWRPFSGVVEWHVLTYDNIAGYMKQLDAIYNKRRDILLNAGVSNIYALPPTQRLQPILVFMEESGVVLAKSDKETKAVLDQLFRLSRAAGIIFCPVDQIPGDFWGDQMVGNVQPFCFRASGQKLQAFGEYHLAGLQTGVLSVGNVHYRVWHTAVQYDLRRLPRLDRRYLVEPKPAESVRESVRENVREGVRPVVDPPPPPPANTDAGGIKWEEWIMDYAATHPTVLEDPPRGIRSLARAMSQHETGSEESVNRYVGIASQTCKLLREKQNA